MSDREKVEKLAEAMCCLVVTGPPPNRCHHARPYAEALVAAEEAQRLLIEIIEKAGLNNLANGVQLGAISWYVEASERMDYARAALAKLHAVMGWKP